MGSFGSELLNSAFFIDPSNVGTRLTTGEIQYYILPYFPEANYNNIRHLAVPGLIVMNDHPKKGKVTISVEKVISTSTLSCG